MKGDKKVNPGEEFIYKLSLTKEFNRDLANSRAELNVPTEGFNNSDSYLNWLKNSGKDIVDISDIWDFFREKYKIPSAYNSNLDDYLFFGRNRTYEYKNQTVIIGEPTKSEIDPFGGDVELYWQKRKEPYAKVLIFGHGRKSDVIKFIDENWGKIESVLEKQGWSRPKVVRETKNKQRNKLIKELYRKTIKELQDTANMKNKNPTRSRYKDILIQNILANEGFGMVNEGYIRKIGPA